MSTLPFISVCCCTYNRPNLLGELIHSFLHQDYPRDRKELIILDDAGQYDTQEGDGWKLISVPWRSHNLGWKRNACAAFISRDSEIIIPADDDDIYLPHWLSSIADGIRDGNDYVICQWTLFWSKQNPDECHFMHYQNHHTLGGCSTEFFFKAGGYPAMCSYEDTTYLNNLHRCTKKHGFILEDKEDAFMIQRTHTERKYQTAWTSDEDYCNRPAEKNKFPVEIGWWRDYHQMFKDFIRDSSACEC